MGQDPLTPLNGAKLDFYCHFVPFAQNSGHTSGQIFFCLHKIFDLRSDSIVKSGAQTFWVYGSRPSDPSKGGKIGLLLPFCPLAQKTGHTSMEIFFCPQNIFDLRSVSRVKSDETDLAIIL